MNYIVVGTGPAAYGCTLKLIKLGIKPTVIDFNFLNLYLYGSTKSILNSKGLAKKSKNGDFSMYEYPEQLIKKDKNLADLPLSRYPGGLSSVWGSNIAVLNDLELSEWTIEKFKMRKAYEEILNNMNFLYEDDDLNERFNFPVKSNNQIDTSIRLLKILKSESNKNESILIGKARNATSGIQNGCISCGKCLTGCPENVIFNSSNYFYKLILQNKINYINGFVDLIKNNYVQILTEEKKINKIYFDKIFIACGSIATTRLLQASKMFPEEVYLKDTQVFYIPILTGRLIPKNYSNYSLAQLFISSKSHEYNDFHMSVYETNDSWRERASYIIGNVSKLIPKLVYGQILAGIGLLPEEHSGKLKITYENEISFVTGIENKNSKDITKKIIKNINKRFKKYNLFFLPQLLSLGNVGGSYHVGSARDTSEKMITNINGQINGIDNVFIVDSTSMPRINTGPITLTIMANSFRITENAINI